MQVLSSTLVAVARLLVADQRRPVRSEHPRPHPPEPGQATRRHRGPGQRADAHAERRRRPPHPDLGPHGWRRSTTGARPSPRRCPAREAAHVKVGQRVRAFPPESRSSMFQAQSHEVATAGRRDVGHGRRWPVRHTRAACATSSRSSPSAGVSVGAERGDHRNGRQARRLRPGGARAATCRGRFSSGVQGELYTQVLDGLKAGRAGRDVRQLLHRRRAQAEGLLDQPTRMITAIIEHVIRFRWLVWCARRRRWSR